ncbi:DMT family transporter [Phyllobacterium endophyticum]|uniref:DMT family transporter n=1 Tax=Phyllobacterium endophyticum TaxID=1149773 RepID=UPI0011C7A27F|nr:DMT family transporter [Phyllobacterium endophyticum]TXR50077.1 DMT family transporter [Phyllobacterium endophyticum]
MGEILGIAAALLSSVLGGTSVAATRYVVDSIDPLALGAFRFGIGFLFLLPVSLLSGGRWPRRIDWAGVAALGALFFGLFPVLFNASLIYTTSARGALALSTLPLLTMLTAALLGIERLTTRKFTGVLVATLGVAAALLTDISSAPANAWRRDLLMVAAAMCMAFYNVWSRPFIARASPITFVSMGMGVGAVILITISLLRDSFEPVPLLSLPYWSAIIFLGLFGAAITFFLWTFALAHTTPTRVAISITVNPIAASLVGMLILDEPFTFNIIIGLAAVCLGIGLATTGTRSKGKVL